MPTSFWQVSYITSRIGSPAGGANVISGTVILEYHYGLYEPTPDTRTDIDTTPKLEQRKEDRKESEP